MMNDVANGIRTYAIYGVSSGFNFETYHTYLSDSVDILSFWNHMPFLYFVKTRLSADMLSVKIKPFYSGSQFIVIETNYMNMNGSMTDQAWRWFLNQAPTEKKPTIEKSALGSILGSRFIE